MGFMGLGKWNQRHLHGIIRELLTSNPLCLQPLLSLVHHLPGLLMMTLAGIDCIRTCTYHNLPNPCVHSSDEPTTCPKMLARKMNPNLHATLTYCIIIYLELHQHAENFKVERKELPEVSSNPRLLLHSNCTLVLPSATPLLLNPALAINSPQRAVMYSASTQGIRFLPSTRLLLAAFLTGLVHISRSTTMVPHCRDHHCEHTIGVIPSSLQFSRWSLFLSQVTKKTISVSPSSFTLAHRNGPPSTLFLRTLTSLP